MDTSGEEQPNQSALHTTVLEKSKGTKKGSAAHRMLLVSLMLGILLGALDQTVVGNSLPKIVADVGGFELYAWVFAAYMLTSTVAVPLAGKFSDLYGRRPIYLIGMGIFVTGSILCAVAQDMLQIIAFRAIQGVGGGLLYPVALATVADVYSPSERGKIQGLMSGVYGFASVIGPFIGGWIVDNVNVFNITSWRWVFLVNVPVGVVAMVVSSSYFPQYVRRSVPSIDYLGSAMITTSLTSLILVAIWGGDTYAWSSLQIVTLATVCITTFVAFVWIETRSRDPLMPLNLFKEPVFTVSAVAMFIFGVGMFGLAAFFPTYLQGVAGISATYSGEVFIPLSATLIAGALVSGLLMKRLGYKIFALTGMLIVSVAMFLMSRLGVGPPIWLVIAEMMIGGLGFGFTVQTYLVASQNAVDHKVVGIATSTLTLVRSLGGTIGVTIFGTLLNRQLNQELPEHIPSASMDQLLSNPLVDGHIERIPSLLLRPEFLNSAPSWLVDGVRSSFADSLSVLLLVGSVVGFLAFVVTLFLKSIPVKNEEEYNGRPEID